MNLPELTEALDEIEFFERERTDHQVVELAVLLYDCGVSLCKVAGFSDGSASSGLTSGVDVDSEVRTIGRSWSAACRGPAAHPVDGRNCRQTVRRRVFAIRRG